MKKIRVMQIVNSLDIGGAERVAVNIATHLDPERFHSFVLTLEGTGPFSSIVEDRNIPLCSLHKKPGARPEVFFGIARQVRKERIDIVTTHNYGPLFYGAPGARMGGCGRLVHVDHNRLLCAARRYPVPQKILSLLAYRVIAVSREIQQNLMMIEGISPWRIMTIANGIDESLFAAPVDAPGLKVRLGIPENRIVIGTGARLVREKGLEHLLDAAALLARTRDDFAMVIVGDGPLKQDLERKARANGLHGRVSFLGARMDVHQIVRLFDIFVLPSLSEGLPLSLLEAMAASRAIVASRVGGIPEVIDHGLSGLLVNPGSAGPLAGALERFMDNPGHRAACGEQARKKFEQRHSARAMAASYARLYERMMHQRMPAP